MESSALKSLDFACWSRFGKYCKVILMKKISKPEKRHLPMEAYRLISSIKNPAKRNLARGYVSHQSLGPTKIEELRRGNSLIDELTIGALLKGRGCLAEKSLGHKRSAADLFIKIPIQPLGWRHEVCYLSGYVNSVAEDSRESLGLIRSLVSIDIQDIDGFLDNLVELAKKFGASNFLSYKLAYVRSANELTAKQLTRISEIEDEIGHKDSPGFHFSAIENISPKISIFTVSQRRATGASTRLDGNIRQSLWTSNLVPTPLCYEDLAEYLLKSTELSLVDSLYSIIVTFNLRHILKDAITEFEARLEVGLIAEIRGIICEVNNLPLDQVVSDFYKDRNINDNYSLDLYRVSSAFLERPRLAAYRSKIDRVVGARLLRDSLEGLQISTDHEDCCELLLQDNGVKTGLTIPGHLDEFYRTYLFLLFIAERERLLPLSVDQITYIFEKTLGLEMLLSESEINDLSAIVPNEAKPLVTVLALALYREKTIDPDVDFEFRERLSQFVKASHGGSIVSFVESLLDASPQVANYIVGALDERTLENTYTLVKNSSQASRIRCDILRAVGQRLSRIEYFVEADSISTRLKLVSLRKYFDGSRMYVDSVAMKKWLDSNPTVATEQYRSLYPRVGARMASVDDPQDGKTDVLVIKLTVQSQYLIEQIAKDAFEQFCLNAEFGIQSYLGRRIRHNTLDGVMINTVDAIIKKPDYQVLFGGVKFKRAVASWMEDYKQIIEKIKRDHLQFKSSASLFKSAIDLGDQATKENIRQLSSALRVSGVISLLNDLVIAFCWKQISPQLDSAARFIKTKLLMQALTSIDKHLPVGVLQIEEQFIADLRDAVNGVFKQVADWFRVPQTGFVTASISELCQTISLDLGSALKIEYLGCSVDKKYTGISVHRLYDCLAVLLQNAFKHGVHGSCVRVSVDSSAESSDGSLDRINVRVTSSARLQDYERTKIRLVDAIKSEEDGIDMVTEGYTGIKKIKFITKTAEGQHTVVYTADDVANQITVGFSLLAEADSDQSESVSS